jgi:predicted CoA-binding protein
MLRLQAACSCEDEFHPQIPDAEKYFTVDKPVIVSFHGYPETMKNMLFSVKNPSRFSVHGYEEEGGTTTAFDMQVRNRTDRYHLAIEIVATAKDNGVIEESKQQQLRADYQKALAEHHSYITRVGADPEEIENWQWSGQRPVTVDTGDQHRFDVIEEARTIAFIGLSDKPERHSHRVAAYFKDKGYRIIPINPEIEETLGEKAYDSLLDIPDSVQIDIVDIFRNPSKVMPHLQEVVDRGGIRTVWLAEGANSHEAEDFAEDYGLHMISNLCIMDVDKANEIRKEEVIS